MQTESNSRYLFGDSLAVNFVERLADLGNRQYGQGVGMKTKDELVFWYRNGSQVHFCLAKFCSMCCKRRNIKKRIEAILLQLQNRLSCTYMYFSNYNDLCTTKRICLNQEPIVKGVAKALFTHRRLRRRFMAVRHSAMLREECVNTLFNPQSSVTHPQ